MTTNETKREQMKQKAVEILKEMDVYSPYIEAFEKNDVVTMFERYAGFWAYQYPELQEKIKDFEQKYKCIVYAVTHEFFEFGECYTFLVVTNYKYEWKTLVEKEKENFEKSIRVGKKSAKAAIAEALKEMKLEEARLEEEAVKEDEQEAGQI